MLVVTALGCGRIAFDKDDASVGSDGGDGGRACTMDEGCDGGVVSLPVVCGDGAVEGDEVCDDANGANGDGCENDCTFSCEIMSECDDEEQCNGVEQCGGHVCQGGSDLPDGTPCGGSSACRGGTCAPAGCGDGKVGPAEECDDENTTNEDGCDNDCTFSCTMDEDCPDDGDACNGGARCELDVNLCFPTSVLEPGDTCDRDANPMTRDICIDMGCVPSLCGDGYIDEGLEACDDSNRIDGDGCDSDCTFSCVIDEDCDDANPCTTEGCIVAAHECVHAVDGDGTDCPGGMCMSGVCTPHDGSTSDGGRDGGREGGVLDPGECWIEDDCPPAEMCCPAPPCVGVCWSGAFCPLIKCFPADSGTS